MLVQHLVQNQHFDYLYPKASHIYNDKGKKEKIGSLLKGKDKHIWSQATSNEFGRLAQGNDAGVKSTDTIKFIPKHEVPSNRHCTYATFVCDHRPLKFEPVRVRIVVGGDKLIYNDDSGSPAAGLLEAKVMFNSVISDAKHGARFCTADLKYFFWQGQWITLNT
jgi:hypothetical protein